MLFGIARYGLVAGAMWILLGGQVQAVEYHVNSSQGLDRSACLTTPGPGAAACKTIQYVIGGVALHGGDIVRVAPGTYRGRITVDTGDAGSLGNPVVFKADGGPVYLEGTDATPLDDSSALQCTAALNCAGDALAYPSVYRFDIGTRAVLGVVETVWTPIRVDDSVVTGVQFDLTKPIPSRPETSVANVQKIPGSWYRNGNYLYVQTYQSVAPSVTANNLEIINSDTIVLSRASYVTFDGFTLRYTTSYGFISSGASNVTLKNATVYGMAGIGIIYNSNSSNGTIDNVDVSHVYTRKDFSVPDQSGASCFTKNCGWHNNAGGTGLKIDGGTTGTTGYLLRGITAYNCWNVMSLEQVGNSRVVDALVKNSPNHTLIIFGTAGATACHNLTIERSLAFNGQDEYYIAGCQNSKALRNAFSIFLGPGNEWTAPSTGWKVRGQLSDNGIYVGPDGTAGFSHDRNWLKETGTNCRIGDLYYGCNSTTWHGLGHDRNSRFGSVLLAGTSWPVGRGLTLSTKTRADFYPVAGSSTIDAGDPDIDGDGVVENGAGGDDECTAAHYCSGSGPDIGPFEFGLVAGGQPPADPPPPPDNVQRSDTR